VPLATIYHNI